MLNGPKSYKSPKKTVRWSSDFPNLWGKNGIRGTKDIQRGAINDDWLLGAAASLSYDIKPIERIFVNQNFTKSDIFQTHLYYKGVK